MVRGRFPVAAGLVTAAVVAVVAWLAMHLFVPGLPRTVVMSTGPAESAYAEYGARYREFFAHEGIELRLSPSAGAAENLARLRDPSSGVSIGFVQGGIADAQQAPDLVALGTISYEPLWFFYRDVELDRDLEGLRGKRISVGAEGSGARVLVTELLARNGIDRDFAEWLSYTPREAETKLLAGEIQAMFMVASWDSAIARRLVVADDVKLASFPRADAYVALYPFLDELVLPAGVGDLAKNRPAEDTVLLAPKASLVVRGDLHPAIQYLLLDAATRIHGGPSIFQKAGQFPAAESVDLPLSDNARQFYKTGRPFLQRYLPVALAVLAGQLLILLLSLAGVLYPLLRLLPGLFGWFMRHRVFRLYGELKALEIELEHPALRADAQQIAARLDRLEERVRKLAVPASFAHMLYTLRVHIRLVRERVEGASGSAESSLRGSADDPNRSTA